MRHAALLLPLALVGLGLAAPNVRADTLELKDGRIVEGAVVEAEGGYVVISRFGSSFLKADLVKARVKAKPVDQQVQEYIAGLADEDAVNRAALAGWLQTMGRGEEARALARQVLDLDPENAAAHAVLGHVRHKGVWRSPDAAKRADGYEKHGATWYTPEEWRNVSDGEKEKAAALEKAAAARKLGEDVNEALRLSLSPDPNVRARGRARLEALAAEYDSKRLRELIAAVDEYVKAIADARRMAADANAQNVISAGGMVMGEIRATLSRLKRPIEVFQTNLASGPIGANAPVRIQLPELEVIRVRTTGIIPAVIK